MSCTKLWETFVMVRGRSVWVHRSDVRCIGLFSLHRCGWVHGDISTNNILLFGDRAILSDLEFATCRGEIVEHDRIVRRLIYVLLSYFSRVHRAHPSPCLWSFRLTNISFFQSCPSSCQVRIIGRNFGHSWTPATSGTLLPSMRDPYLSYPNTP